MEIRPNIHLLKVPIPDNPLEYLNAYLIKTNEGSVLIDTGWNIDEAFHALTNQLQEIGVTWPDVKYIVITHAHPDHFGLVGRLVQHTKAQVVMHELESAFIHQRFLDYEDLLAEMGYWLRINGVPEDTRTFMQRSSLSHLGYVAVAKPHILVRGGEHLQLGDIDLEIIWTPGHSRGHICLYEPNRRILFSGDHVLAKITPNISMHVQSISNPLPDFLSTLNSIAKLPVEIVLPAHGDVFTTLKERTAQIRQHHRDRNNEIIETLLPGALNAYQVSAKLTWSTGGKAWEDLPDFIRRSAVTETIAHLELLFAQGRLEKTNQNGVVIYSAVTEEP